MVFLRYIYSVNIPFVLVAELVTWNPVGDQYVIGYETALSICDVQVSITC